MCHQGRVGGRIEYVAIHSSLTWRIILDDGIGEVTSDSRFDISIRAIVASVMYNDKAGDTVLRVLVEKYKASLRHGWNDVGSREGIRTSRVAIEIAHRLSRRDWSDGSS